MADERKTTVEFFSHFSREDKPTKAGAWLSRASARAIFKYINVVPGSSILEIGPGRGDFADICLARGLEYLAVEASEEMAGALEKRGARTIRAMAPPLPRIESQFDFVLMINVMEHMNSMQDALQITREIKEVLKPGGRFVICSPDYLNWRAHFFNCDFSHNYVTTARRLRQLMINGGLKNVRSRHFSVLLTGFVCFPFTGLVSYLPFGFLHTIFPNSRAFYKLYKIQLTFLRKVLAIGENHG